MHTDKAESVLITLYEEGSKGWADAWSNLKDKTACCKCCGEVWQYHGTTVDSFTRMPIEHCFRHRHLNGQRVYKAFKAVGLDVVPKNECF